MKTILNIAVVLLLTLTIVSCEDDLQGGEGIPQIYVTGPVTAKVTDVKTYTVGDASGSFTWSVDDADIASVTGSGNSADVTFKKHGIVRVSVTDGSMSGYIDVMVPDLGLAVTTSYKISGAINDGATDTVFFTFSTSLASTPVLTKNGLNAADTSGLFFDSKGKALPLFESPGDDLTDLAAYKGSATKYFALYTGGTGNGQPEARFEKVTPDENYSSANPADSVYVLLPKVDNVVPISTPGAAVPTIVASGLDLTYSVSFNEAMRPTLATDADTAIFVIFEYTRKVNGVDKLVKDTVEYTSTDMMAWSASYTVSDSIADAGVITVTTVGDWVDLAGNAYVNGPLAAPSDLTVDAAGPTDPASSASEPLATPVGSDRWVTLTASGSSDAGGIGLAGYYYVLLDEGEDAPTSIDDFSGDLIKDGKVDILMSTAEAAYDVYWIAVDKYGIASGIVTGSFSYDASGVFTGY